MTYHARWGIDRQNSVTNIFNTITKGGAGEGRLVSKLGDLSLIPGTHTVEEQN